MKRNKNIKLKDLFVFLLIVLCIFISFYIPIASFAGLLIGVAYIILKKLDSNTFYILLFLLPFAQVFKFTPESTSFFTILEMTIIIKWLIVKKRISIYFLPIILVGVYSFLVSVIATNIDLFQSIKVFLNLSLILLFIESYNEKSLVVYTFYYCGGLILASIIGLFKLSIPGFMAMYSDLNLTIVNGVRVLRFSGTLSDPNYYSIAIVVGIGLLIAIFAKGLGNLKFSIMGIVLLVFGLYTYSKSFIIMIGILFLLILILLIINQKLTFLMLVVPILIIIIFTGAVSRIELIQDILSRFDFSEISFSSVTTGRTLIWDEYIRFIKSDYKIFFLGDGLGAPYLGGAAHNIYIQTWYHIGFIGILLYVFSLITIFKSHNYLKNKSIINYFLIAIVASMYFFLNGFNAFEFPFYIMISWIVLNTKLCYKQRKQVEYENN